MADFPWEILKAETLRALSRDLGIKSNLTREEIIVFLRAVQKKGLGSALADEISKEFKNKAATGSNETPSSTPRKASRPTASRKRRAPEPESDNNDNKISENEKDENGDSEAAEPDSPARNTRHGSTKRVRLSDPGPLRTRSRRRDSAPATRGAANSTRSVERAPLRSSLKGKDKNAKKSVKVVETIRDSDVDYGEDEDGNEVEDEAPESEEEMEAEAEDTGPRALASALMQARKPNAAAGRKARRAATATKSRSVTTATQRPKPRPSSTKTGGATTQSAPSPSSPRTRSATGDPSPVSKISGRTVKPTMKAASLSPTKRPTSILSKPLHTQRRGMRKEGASPKRARTKSKLGKATDSAIAPVSSANGGGLGEIFDGVVLKKRRVGDGTLQLDEFVANGLELERGHVNGIHENAADAVLEREELSSLAGSNKENDFSFRDLGDASMSMDGIDDQLLVGEEDAEGEPEPETNPQDPIQPQAELNDLPSALTDLPSVLTVNPQEVEAPQPEPVLEPVSEPLV